MPQTEAVVALLETLWGRDLRENGLLAALGAAPLPEMLRDGIGRPASGSGTPEMPMPR
jgi:hypothetical protein